MTRHAMAVVLLLMLVTGCRGKQEKPKEEKVPGLAGARPVVVELVTGDVLRLELMMEEEDAYHLKGIGGTGRFPKVLVRRISDAPPESTEPMLPGKDLLRKKMQANYVAKTGGYIFHKLNCRMARNIDEADRALFETREEALQRGFRPCGVCNP